MMAYNYRVLAEEKFLDGKSEKEDIFTIFKVTYNDDTGEITSLSYYAREEDLDLPEFDNVPDAVIKAFDRPVLMVQGDKLVEIIDFSYCAREDLDLFDFDNIPDGVIKVYDLSVLMAQSDKLVEIKD